MFLKQKTDNIPVVFRNITGINELCLTCFCVLIPALTKLKASPKFTSDY